MAHKISLLTKAQREEMMDILSSCFPDPKSELHFSNPFELLCAVVLSAQTTDESVNRVTPELFRIAPTSYLMSLMSIEQVSKIIRTIGLYKSKASYLVKLSKMLCNEFDGKVPDTYDKLIKLPGVGSKTAKVVLNVAFHMPTVAVDTHIFRVCNRTGFCLGKNPKEVEDKIVSLIDSKYLITAHHLLLLHGRYICKARGALCSECKIASLCKKRM